MLSHKLGKEGLQLRTIHGDTDLTGGKGAPLVILGLEDPSIVARIRKHYAHIVAVQSYPDNLDVTQVHFDDFRIGHDAGRLLVENGHSNLVHLAGPEEYPSAAERKRGFLQSAASLGARAQVVAGKMNWQSGERLGAKVLELLDKSDPPTAVFAANDWMALGLMHRLKEKGIRVPADVALIGCDDIHLSSEVEPALATFRWDMEFLISELFTLLDAETAMVSQVAKRVLLPAEFVPRASLPCRGV